MNSKFFYTRPNGPLDSIYHAKPNSDNHTSYSIMIYIKWMSLLKLTLHCWLYHIDHKDVANAANKDDEAEHDWDKVLSDDVDILLLLLGEGHVTSQGHFG